MQRRTVLVFGLDKPLGNRVPFFIEEISLGDALSGDHTPPDIVLLGSSSLWPPERAWHIRDMFLRRGWPVLLLAEQSFTVLPGFLDFVSGVVPECELNTLDITIERVLEEREKQRQVAASLIFGVYPETTHQRQ